MTTKVTLKAIAEKLGLSQATVCSVLNEKPGASEHTKALVANAAFELDYFARRNSADHNPKKRYSSAEKSLAGSAKTPTIYDIASELQLSTATVNRALNGDKAVNKNTATKVLKAAADMGYIQNFNASALKNNKDLKVIVQKRVTIYDIAKQLHISAATVSRCFNDNCSVSPATKEKVLKKAKKLGFVLDTAASQLRKSGNYTIGVFISGCNSDISKELINGVQQAANEYGINIMMGEATNGRPELTLKSQKIIAQNTDGLLVIGTQSAPANPLLKAPKKIKPVIYLNLAQGRQVVDINPLDAVYTATMELLHNNCKEILFVDHADLSMTYFERLSGFKKALAEYAIPFSKNKVINYISNKNAIKKIGSQVKNKADLPHGLLIVNPNFKSQLIDHLKQSGEIPLDHIRVVDVANQLTNNHTVEGSLSVDPFKAAQQAAIQLIEQIFSVTGYKSKIAPVVNA